MVPTIAAKIEKAGWDRLRQGAAVPEGAGQDAERPRRRRRLSAGHAAAGARRQGRQAARCGARSLVKLLRQQLDAASTDWKAPSRSRAAVRDYAEKHGPEAGQSCTATARRAHRQHGVAAGVRRHGGAGPGRGPGAASATRPASHENSTGICAMHSTFLRPTHSLSQCNRYITEGEPPKPVSPGMMPRKACVQCGQRRRLLIEGRAP